MIEATRYQHLYEIAFHLNSEFNLSAALRIALEKTAEALELQTGWIWLAEKDLKSVYLAASYNLPPALKDQPERLSGWCYCIERYLSGKIEGALNVSEITCTRLKDLSSGTQDLKYHATVPIMMEDMKVGLINLLSEEKQQLSGPELSFLDMVSKMIGTTIQRTRLQSSYGPDNQDDPHNFQEILDRVLTPKVSRLSGLLQAARTELENQKTELSLGHIQQSIEETGNIREQLDQFLNAPGIPEDEKGKEEFRYPSSPLTKRELEVIKLVKTGYTNNQIAEQLYISERTVKFHISSILSKLYAKTRTEAVNTALKRGLISY